MVCVFALALMTVATGFTKVELSRTGELTHRETGTESLTIPAENNNVQRLTSKVSGDPFDSRYKAQYRHCPGQADHLLLDREGPHGSRAVGCPAASAHPISRLRPSASRSAAQERSPRIAPPMINI